MCHGRGGGGNRENGGVIIVLNLVLSVGIEKGKKMKESKEVGILDYQQLYLHRWDTNFLLQFNFKYICYYLITCVRNRATIKF